MSAEGLDVGSVGTVTAPLSRALADVLAAHRLSYAGQGRSGCSCGDDRECDVPTHDAHVAELLAAAVAEWLRDEGRVRPVAEAMEDAAEGYLGRNLGTFGRDDIAAAALAALAASAAGGAS